MATIEDSFLFYLHLFQSIRGEPRDFGPSTESFIGWLHVSRLFQWCTFFFSLCCTLQCYPECIHEPAVLAPYFLLCQTCLGEVIHPSATCPVLIAATTMTVATKPHLIMILHSNSNISDNEDENKNVVIQLQKIDPIIKN